MQKKTRIQNKQKNNNKYEKKSISMSFWCKFVFITNVALFQISQRGLFEVKFCVVKFLAYVLKLLF